MTEDKKWMLPLGGRQGPKDLPFHEKKGNPVEEIKEGMKVVQETKAVAEELSGSKELKEERDKAKEALAQEREEAHKKEIIELKDLIKKYAESQDMPRVRELERQLQEKDALYHREQIEDLRQDIAELRKPEKGAGDIAQKIKEIKEASKELGLTSGVTTTPPDILLELKRMDQELKIKLEEMKDERDRRDKEWQLTLKKWDDERELRISAAQQKYEVDKERTETLKSSFDRGMKIIGRALTEEETGAPIAQAYHVEAGEGEMGEFACPKCRATVAIAPDTVKAVCVRCGFIAPVKRIKPSPPPAPPQEAGVQDESTEQVG